MIVSGVEGGKSGKGEGIARAEEFAGLGGGDAGVGGEAVEVVEAGERRPGGQCRLTEFGETLLEALQDGTGAGIAGRNGAASAGIAALEGYFADGEADHAAFVFPEEAVFPEGGNSGDFESSAEAETDVVDGEAGEPRGDGLQRSCGDDGGAIGNGIVGESPGVVADDDLLLEENTEPFAGVFVGFREGEGARRDLAAIAGDGESDRTEVRRVTGTNDVDQRRALAMDPFAVGGVESPGAVEGQSTGGRDAGLRDRHGVEGLDGVEADVGQRGSRGERLHGRILAERSSP